jgi:POT family proton-dependent oligopeptide transporter
LLTEYASLPLALSTSTNQVFQQVGQLHDTGPIAPAGDFEKLKPSYVIESTPVFDGEGVAQEAYYNIADDMPTNEELHTLRRVSDYIPPRAYTVAFVELVERLSYYGTVQVFVNFIQQKNPGTSTGKALYPNSANAQPGALGLGQEISTALTTFNQFWV